MIGLAEVCARRRYALCWSVLVIRNIFVGHRNAFCCIAWTEETEGGNGWWWGERPSAKQRSGKGQRKITAQCQQVWHGRKWWSTFVRWVLAGQYHHRLCFRCYRRLCVICVLIHNSQFSGTVFSAHVMMSTITVVILSICLSVCFSVTLVVPA